MIRAFAFLPAPPVLVPAVASGAAPELAALRAACAEALAAVLAGAERVVLLGPEDWPPPRPRAGARSSGSHPGPEVPAGLAWTAADPSPVGGRAWPAGSVGTLSGIGVPVDASLGGEASPSRVADPAVSGLPLSLTVGAWLLAQADWAGEATGLSVAPDLPAAACRDAGVALASSSGGPSGPPVAVVVLGEGSACRTPASPGSFDPAAEAYDTAITAALATADVPALLGLDVTTGLDLLASGRAPWQVAAAAARSAGSGPGAAVTGPGSAVVGPGSAWRGRLIAAEAPYGVGYVVATWARE